MKLAVVSANSYDRNEIDSAIDDLFSQLGGVRQFIGDAKNVFIKVNLVRELAPERGGTTHPEIVRAVAAKILAECDCHVTVGDSSGGAYTKGHMGNIYRTTKMDYACEQSNAKLNANFEYVEADVNGLLVKKIPIISAFTESDVVINIGKLKTHSFTGYTGCVKNLYGLIPGLIKVETHSKYPNIDDFIDCLLDLEQYAKNKISLHILDAVIGMEGEGPTNGKPRFIGKIMACANPYIVDAAGVTLFANPKEMPILSRAVARKLVLPDFCETDYNFDDLKKDFIADFDKVQVLYQNFIKMPKWLQKFMKSNLCPKVKPNKKECKGCGKCVQHCPASAISIGVDKKAKVNQSKCIRCYCCQELCPFNAIILKKPLVYKVVRGFSHGKNKDKSKHLTNK